MPRWPTSLVGWGTGARSDSFPSAIRSAVPIISSIGCSVRRTVSQTTAPVAAMARRHATTTMSRAVRAALSTSRRGMAVTRMSPSGWTVTTAR